MQTECRTAEHHKPHLPGFVGLERRIARGPINLGDEGVVGICKARGTRADLRLGYPRRGKEGEYALDDSRCARDSVVTWVQSARRRRSDPPAARCGVGGADLQPGDRAPARSVKQQT